MHTSPDCDISVPCHGLIETDRNKAIAQTAARNVRYSLPPLFYKTSFNTAIYMTPYIYGSTYQTGILRKCTVAYILIIAISPGSGSRGILGCIAIEWEHYGINRHPAPGAGQMLTPCSGRWTTVSPQERRKVHSLLTIHAHEPRL